MNRCLFLAVVAQLLATPAASGALILYEPFDYATGPLAGNGGGLGFSGNWTMNRGTPQVTSPGLTDGSLQTAGNAATNGGGTTQAYRNFNNAGLTDDGDTYWFSVLFDAPGDVAGTTATLPTFFADNSLQDAQKSGFSFKFDMFSETTASFDTRINDSISANVNVTSTNWYADTHLVVGKIEFSGTAGQDRISIWLNPSLTAEPTDPPLSTKTGDWVDPGAKNSFYYSKYNAPARTIDEVRLGTTFADVVPTAVPEPGVTLAVLVGSLAAAACRSSRRRRAG